ncbi:MAG: hypothetical protein AAGE65_07870, partial [Planctomycetota bacterium]
VIAAEVVAKVEALGPDEPVALLLRHAGISRPPGSEAGELFPRDPDRLPAALAAGGDTDHTAELMRRVAYRLYLAGVTPNALILDYEDGASYWQLGDRSDKDAWAERIERLWQLNRETMPADLAGDATRDALAKQQGRGAIVAYNAWAYDVRTAALRRAVFEPWSNAYGRTLPGGNYGESRRAWATADRNGWPQHVDAPLSGTWSCPVVYLNDWRGNRYLGLSVEQRVARAWLDHRNRVRSALMGAASALDVAPWYSNPDFGRPAGYDVDAWRWAWVAGLLHDRRQGVSRMLLWGEWSDDELKFASPVFAALHAVSADGDPAMPLPERDAAVYLAGWSAEATRLIQDGGAR